MVSNRRSRAAALLFSLIPGWGHVYLGREGQGLLIFTLAAISGFTLLNATWIYLGHYRDWLIGSASVSILGLLLFSVVDVFRRTSPGRLERLHLLYYQLLWQGMMNFARSDFPAAQEKFLECSRLDRLDVEPVFRAGVAASRRGARREAKRLLLKAQQLDIQAKWCWEIERELEILENEAGAGIHDHRKSRRNEESARDREEDVGVEGGGSGVKDMDGEAREA